MTNKKFRSKSYRLCDNRSGETFILKVGRTGKLTIYDPQKQVRRAIRHCPNQKSIFMDEQDTHALVEPIIFRFGQLEVPPTQPITQKFLDSNPHNTANGGTVFEEVNTEIEAKEGIRDEEIKTDIRVAIRDIAKEDEGIHKLSAIVAVMTGSIEEATSMGIESLKRFLYNEVDNNHTYFTDEEGNVTIFEDEFIHRKYITLRALKEQIIKKSIDGKSMLWSSNNKVIATAPRSLDLVDFFAEFLSTEDGMIVAEEIARRS